MIAVIDPAFFVGRTHDAVGEAALRHDIRAILSFRQATDARLVAADDYWPTLWQELISPLQQAFPRLMSDFGELRKAGVKHQLQPLVGSHRFWGFVPMFQHALLPLNQSWPDRMARSIIRMHISLGERIVLIVRPIEGRNIRRHGTGNSILDETTRWQLYFQSQEPRPVSVACVNRPRHVKLPWTIRFDWRLPSMEDNARYPFCPPYHWGHPSVAAVGTHSAKPAFIDARGYGWARPNIAGGTGYHWDVFISDPQEVKRVGVDQINVVEYGAPATEGLPGSLHHVPKNKQHLVNDCGWTCPAS